MKRKAIFFSIGIITTLLILVSGCAGNNSTTGNLDTSGVSLGHLIVKITDAPGLPEIDRVMLTITGMEVHMAGTGIVEQEQEQEQNNGETQNQENNQNQNDNNGGWTELQLVNAVNGELTFNLLDYQNGLQLTAVMADLQPGTYTQIRMDVKSLEIGFTDEPGDENLKPAKLPSNVLKFVSPFEIVDGQDTQLLFDINALQSVHQTGNETYMFRPVVKLDIIESPVEALIITTSVLPEGTVGLAYPGAILGAAGGKGPYTWSLDAGSALPGDLTLSPAGVISGSINAADEVKTYDFTVKVQDSAFPKGVATQALSINILAAPVTP